MRSILAAKGVVPPAGADKEKLAMLVYRNTATVRSIFVELR